MAKESVPRPLQIAAGTRPLTEGTALTTNQWIYALGIRFVNGLPQKVGGWESVPFSYSNAISGKCRSIFSVNYNNQVVTMYGTHTRLYSAVGSVLTNVTPLAAATVAVANGLATLYGTLANNALTTVNGSNIVTVADASASRHRAGDNVTLAGATAFNNISLGDINTSQVVRSVDPNGLWWTFSAADNANASGAGGGNAIVRKTGLIQVTKAAHGLPDGDRVKIAGAADTGGILLATINLEFIIRLTGVNTFDVFTTGTATSAVTGAGGAGTTYQQQIAAGLADPSSGQGYGEGKYGVGLYGTALQSSATPTPPQIWFWCEQQFSNVLICTPGNQGSLYEWNANTVAAPVLVTNAPTTINYAFISDNIVVTLGNVNGNRIKTSDQGDRTNWTSSSTNSVFVEDVQGAGKFISHVHVDGLNLLFTSNQTYTFRFIGGVALWDINQIEPEVGIIAPMARCQVNGIAYWVGQNNFYMFNGATVAIIPANTQPFSTCMKYFFNNMNRSQESKIFMWYNEAFNEIQIHYPSIMSTECDSILRLNLYDYSWTIDAIDRTAAEYPVANQTYPLLVSAENIVYRHESGVDADGAGMTFSLTSPDMLGDKNNTMLSSVVPDNVQTGNITINRFGRRFPQSSKTSFNHSYTANSATERIETTEAARFWRYTIGGSTVGQTWIMGQWFEELQPGPPQ